jgi:hypothetical protein
MGVYKELALAFLLLAVAAGILLFVAKYLAAAFEDDHPAMFDCSRLVFTTYNIPVFACDTIDRAR